MKLTRATNIEALPDEEKNLVLIAREANRNTLHGGASALSRVTSDDEESVVSEVYSLSSGRVPDHLDAWECPECGSVHYGMSAAIECCMTLGG